MTPQTVWNALNVHARADLTELLSGRSMRTSASASTMQKQAPDVPGVECGRGALAQECPVLRVGAGREHGGVPLEAQQLF